MDFFTGERELWEFWEFLNRLPDGSYTKVAMSNDPEVAQARVNNISDEEIEKILDSRTVEKDREISPIGYNLTIEKLNQLIDAVTLNTETTRAVFGGKKMDRFKPQPRPKTEFERLLDKKIYAHEKADQERTMQAFGF